MAVFAEKDGKLQRLSGEEETEIQRLIASGELREVRWGTLDGDLQKLRREVLRNLAESEEAIIRSWTDPRYANCLPEAEVREKWQEFLQGLVKEVQHGC